MPLVGAQTQTPNQPVFVTAGGQLASTPGGIPFSLQIMAVDSGPNPPATLTFSLAGGTLPPGMTLQANGLINGTPTNADGDYASTITASNGQTSAALGLSIVIYNTPPAWVTPTSVIGKPLTSGAKATFTLLAHDPNGDKVNYKFVSGNLPPGLTLNTATGVISGTVGNVKSTDKFLFNVLAQDGHSGETARNFVIAADGTGSGIVTLSNPEWVSPVDLLNVTVSEDYYLDNAQVSITVDGNQIGGPTTITAIYPTGSMVIPVSGDFGPGIHTVIVDFLNDAVGPDGDRNVHVLGLEYGGIPFNTGLPNEQYSQGPVSYLFGNNTCFASAGTVPANATIRPIQFVASDPLSLAVTYRVTGGTLPSSLHLNPATGQLTGIGPNVPAGTMYTFTVTASDIKGGLAPKTFTLSVIQPDTVQWISPAVGTVVGTYISGAALSLPNFVAASTGSYNVNYTTTSGVALTPALGDGVTVAGTFTGTLAKFLTIKASDGVASAVTATWIVQPYAAPVWLTQGLAISQGLNIPVNVQLQVMSSHPPITYKFVSGTLPPGISLNSTSGLISGTPTQHTSPATFALAAIDGNGVSTRSPAFTTGIQDVYYAILVSDLTKAKPGTRGLDLLKRSNQYVGNTATLVTDPFGRANAAVYYAAGNRNGGVEFTGDFYGLSLLPTDKFTFEFWLYKDGPGGYGNVVICSGQFGAYWSISYVTTGIISTLDFIIALVSNNGVLVPWGFRGTIPLPINQWVHVALTSNGITTVLWINGQEAGSEYSQFPCSYDYYRAQSLGMPSFAVNSNPHGYQNVTNFPYLDIPAVNFAIGGVRLISGVALYYEPFTPPTAPFTADPSDAA